jgi:adenosylmethionine-8-amino-7-oxononanoate aminotransferase
VTPAFLHPFARPTRQEFVSIVSGDGAVVTDAEGNQYVDAMASLWYCAIGHGRREMAEVIARQAATLAAYSCFEPFTNPVADALAERLVALSPVDDARVFLCQSGSEAVDTAMKLARLTHVLNGHPERTLIISRMRGYHGTNYGGTTAQGLPPNKEGWGPLLAEVVQAPSDDVEALATLMAERGHEVAAVLTEPVQGAGGVWPPGDGYLASVRRLCDQHGALLIFDEVITGFGRLGAWFGSQYFGVVPDLTTFAKAVTSGYQPLGGIVVGAAVRAALESDPAYVLKTGFTYSGHATCCAAALTNLDIIADEGLLDAPARIGARLGGGLRALADDGVIGGARGLEGVWAAAMRPGVDAVAVRDRLLRAGVISRAIGDHSLAFCPPLVISDSQIDQVVDALAAAAAG